MPATTEARHPNGDIIVFTEEDHKYRMKNGSPTIFVSGTSFVHHYFPEFDAETVSMKVARKELGGMVDEKDYQYYANELRSQWKAKADYACLYGTRVHEICEDFMQNLPPRNTPNSQKEKTVMNNGYFAVNMFKALGWKLIGVELIVFSENDGVCGTIDLLMYDPVEGVYWILDWKTNGEIKFNNNFSDGLGLEPIQHVVNCNFFHYALQLNFYQKIMVDEGYVPKGSKFRRAIIHLNENEPLIVNEYLHIGLSDVGRPVYELPDMQNEITAMLLDLARTCWSIPF